ncbi:MAG: redox-sensitive bicupin YhaK (pirin superfamily) [Patiriisocius sp.]|jgi:redox-sensitive bicupin YhaK (pirin superfamily)
MRKLVQVITAQPTRDGDGVKIHRLAGSGLHQVLNPFLMIDEINSDDAADYIGGFPEHPHRGFETITYMKAGRMRHRDHMGNEGIIDAGDVQWMTAGAGVLHSEMPEQENGLLHGFQIWLNLPAAEKMKPAAYQEILSADIAEQALPDGGMVRVIAGKVHINQQPQQGPLPDISTQPVFLDVQLGPNETVELSFKSDNTAMVYAYKGGTDVIAQRQLGIYTSGNRLHLRAGSMGAELLVLSGQPINEPLVQYGPFVMNTSEEIERALTDFQNPQFIGELTSNQKVG